MSLTFHRRPMTFMGRYNISGNYKCNTAMCALRRVVRTQRRVFWTNCGGGDVTELLSFYPSRPEHGKLLLKSQAPRARLVRLKAYLQFCFLLPLAAVYICMLYRSGGSKYSDWINYIRSDSALPSALIGLLATIKQLKGRVHLPHINGFNVYAA
jgi:hypothetical protein